MDELFQDLAKLSANELRRACQNANVKGTRNAVVLGVFSALLGKMVTSATIIAVFPTNKSVIVTFNPGHTNEVRWEFESPEILRFQTNFDAGHYPELVA